MACNILIADSASSTRRVLRKVPYISGVVAGTHTEAKWMVEIVAGTYALDTDNCVTTARFLAERNASTQ